ncbi:quinone-dependent dihydroorotate dehydrogenase [Candidatus Kaiserbacteria bacterium CG_4_9_14_3_um_filter_50_16]|uniref:Dihydroorotate dehydrogenase (quinone) n=1 Tax=Candidatus Kaiserbacteria bacterium CG17_big_fil_post_rev_8_21_14_2_50_51_7 TaxID=1974613 RepID=A0A2M7FBP6_9BACT|nr:MAG: quinone-dependent dihydroorotate dehydrogenase [Candidatus Kaiserbacteria bacterium CG17_big_fil_post_rev_8_21_14_2_50_51_7]PJA01142.1 MAG: quinone-dependent dihydroorotate dehydrogenase [Candidatus Kaiserbacteria bacterium CG_4_10_14_0_2_um_filter_50_16]PJA94539.1 MAG: quinone-dependent dihydroorotate dehydrogenase [Candidatus Kaiserbacteria bacterium CG_4_9_14_3_um_filter_50_16]
MGIMDIFYRYVLKPIMFRFDADTVHEVFIAIGETAGRFTVSRKFFEFIYGYRGSDISKTVDGIRYRIPILLSAGFDAEGRLSRILPSLAFGGEEIGSITAHPCDGNPRPRLTRLIRNKSFVVYKGLRNCGVDALIERLTHMPRVHGFVLGISIARTNSEAASVDAEAGIRDYVESFQKLTTAGIGDYYTLNISCPNSHTGETFTDPLLLTRLLSRIQEIKQNKPVYLKMPINVSWEQFSALLAIADRHGVQGLVIGNVNKKYSDLMYPEDAPKEFRGGLSGAPCFVRSNELIRKTRERYGKRFTIIGSGGIFTPGDAMEKFSAGADLVQLITGMVYIGPGLMKEICKRYAKEVSS